MPGVSLVTVATFANAMEASLAKGFLEAAGIPAFLADEQMVGMNWHMSILLGGVKLQVSADDAEEAVELLGMAEEREN